MSNTFITFTVLSKDQVAIKHSRGSSLGAEKQFLKVRSRNYLPFSSNGGDTQTDRQTDTTTAITLCPCFAGEG